MISIGSYEAKTKFSELLERIAKGESFIITRHGVPAARLVPADGPSEEDRAQAIESLASISSRSLLGASLEDARAEGRK